MESLKVLILSTNLIIKVTKLKREMSKLTKNLLFVFLLSGGAVVGQNIDKNVEACTYTRMPSHPFPNSVESYHITKELYTGPGESKYEIAKKIDNAIKLPRLTKSTEGEGANFLVRVEGFTRGDIETTETSRKEKRGDEEVSVPYYNYVFSYKYPIYYEVSLPNGAEPIDRTYLIDNKSHRYSSPSFKSRSQLSKWWAENRSSVKTDLRKKLLNQGMSTLKQRVDSRFAFTVVTEGVTLYTVKKFKGFDYADVDAAYETAKEAIATIEPSDRVYKEEFTSKMELAIEQWEKILLDKDLEKRKTRINSKVAERMYRNIFQALVMMDRFDDALALKAQAESLVKNPIPSTMEYQLKNKQNRYNANLEEIELRMADN